MQTSVRRYCGCCTVAVQVPSVPWLSVIWHTVLYLNQPRRKWRMREERGREEGLSLIAAGGISVLQAARTRSCCGTWRTVLTLARFRARDASVLCSFDPSDACLAPVLCTHFMILSSLSSTRLMHHSSLSCPHSACLPALCTYSSLPRGCLQSTANPLLLGCNSSITVIGAITRYHTRFTRALASPWQARECLSCLVFLRVIMRFSDASRYVGCACA